MPLEFFVYIIYSSSIDKYYIGQTYNLLKRITEHNQRISRFTKRANDWKLVYSESFKTRQESMRREKEMKSKKSVEFIKRIVNSATI